MLTPSLISFVSFKASGGTYALAYVNLGVLELHRSQDLEVSKLTHTNTVRARGGAAVQGKPVLGTRLGAQFSQLPRVELYTFD